VRLDRPRRRIGPADAEAYLRCEPASLQKGIGCQRLDEARRARDAAGGRTDSPLNPRHAFLVGAVDSRPAPCVKGENAPHAEDRTSAETDPDQRHQDDRLQHEPAIADTQRDISSICSHHALPYGRIKRATPRGCCDCRRGTFSMSGIIGIVGRSPVDLDLLNRMTGAQTFRGPDAQTVWANGSVGFGHATLATGDAARDAGPVVLDGRVITADARIDRRADLASRLVARGHRGVDAADTSGLILHAYLEWGEGCVDYLLGDFAFAIWDDVKQRLFCARDRFGVKPFYYADTSEGFVFSNTLDSLRVHPAVDDSIHEPAIGDFLLFGYNLDDATTAFAGISRLPPAHVLTRVTDARVRRYWTIPTDGCLRYARSEDYVDHFRDVFASAVSDRLPATRCAISMSGGLDSTSMAATAQRVAIQGGARCQLRAHTVVYDSLFADGERAFAKLTASALSLETSVFAADEYEPFHGWAGLSTPEPTDDSFFCMRTRQLGDIASTARVLLCGEGGDEVLWSSYVVDLMGRMRLLELAGDVVRGVATGSRRPGLGLRRWLRARLGACARPPAFPAWIDPALAKEHDLRSRWDAWHSLEPPCDHPLRPEAHGRLTIAPWAWYFEAFDPGVTRVPVELRYPFLDLRVVEYLLALPPIPWCVDKHLLRIAMRGMLPDVIRLRPKAPMGGDPLTAHLQRTGSERIDRFEPGPELAAFVERRAVPPLAATRDADHAALLLRPYCLDHWLRRAGVRPRTSKETSHGWRAVVHAG
jgi:asparagine synthase (glutamine-hydrolysing)